MKRICLAAIAAATISGSVFAFGGVYVNAGGGYVIPTQNAALTANSNSVLYSPTVPGTSLFQLRNVNWQSKFNNGYDLFGRLVLACQIISGEKANTSPEYAKKRDG